MDEETVLLSWKSFQPHLRTTLKDLYIGKNHIADVTLVSEDQKQIQAHKFVLSACSQVLKNLLLANPHPHPIIYLRGVEHQELLALLQFMNLGEATIVQERIKKFFEVAKDLEITEMDKDGDAVIVNVDKDVHKSVSEYNGVVSTIEEHVDLNVTVPKYIHNQDLSEIKMKSDKVVGYSCSQCDHFEEKQWGLIKHKKSKHEDELFYCDECEYKITTHMSLKNHQQFGHEGAGYSCYQCDYQASTQWQLVRHQESKNLKVFVKEIFSNLA